jgi:hypothetical protein
LNEREEIALLQTVVACMVEAAGGEIRISRASLEDPPEIEMDDDPISGDWIYRTATR